MLTTTEWVWRKTNSTSNGKKAYQQTNQLADVDSSNHKFKLKIIRIAYYDSWFIDSIPLHVKNEFVDAVGASVNHNYELSTSNYMLAIKLKKNKTTFNKISSINSTTTVN